MGKIILEFDSREEYEEARAALNGSEWKSILCELDQELRGAIKHGVSLIEGSKISTSEERETYRHIREIIRTKVEDSGLKLYD
jgi:hypothetical protein